MASDPFVQQGVQRLINRVVLERLRRMVRQSREDAARERRALRLLIPALMLIALSYALILLLA
jgi:hypothetical protein